MNVFGKKKRTSAKVTSAMATIRTLPGSQKNLHDVKQSSTEDQPELADDIIDVIHADAKVNDADALKRKIKAVCHAHGILSQMEPKHHLTHHDFLKAHLQDQIRDDLAIGIYRKKQVLPECRIPSNNSQDDGDVDIDEKIDTVLSDPKFGMFSLFMWHWKEGYKNRQLQEKNVVYCSHIFSLWSGLPLLVFVSQWTMYIALLMYIYDYTQTHSACPQHGKMHDKILMLGVTILYFVKSFFLWDALVDRSRRKKVNPTTSIIVLIDGLQEIGFNLLCYFANLWIVFSEENIINAILDSLAMEFLMVIDNQFEELYFQYLPGNAVKIYDELFVTYADNQALVNSKKRTSCMYMTGVAILKVPYKILQLCLFLFPFMCIFMMFYGTYCK